MPIPPYLALKGKGGAPIQMHEILAGVAPNQLGSDLAGTTGWARTTQARNQYAKLATNFKGERFCLVPGALGNPEVRREDEGGAGTWGVVFTGAQATQSGTAETHVSGLFAIKDGGNNDIILAFAYPQNGASGTIRICTSPTGASGSWTETIVSGLVPFSLGMTHVAVLFQNRIVVPDGASTAGGLKTWEIDPVAGTVTGSNVITTENGGGWWDMCVFNDTLYAVGYSSAPNAGAIALYQFGGGVWSNIGEINAGAGTIYAPSGVGKPCLFTDNTNMYLLTGEVIGVGQTASTAYQGTPSSFPWTRSETPVPNAYNSNTVRADAAAADQWGVIVDNESDPVNPDFYIMLIPGLAGALVGAAYEILQWNGFGAVMGPAPGASVSSDFFIPEVKQGGGEHISQGAATYGEIEDETAIAGAYRLSYRTPGAVAGLTGRVYYSTGQGPPDTLATLVGGSNTFGPITGDGRASLRTVDIDLGLSGITPPDVSTWMIDLRP